MSNNQCNYLKRIQHILGMSLSDHICVDHFSNFSCYPVGNGICIQRYGSGHSLTSYDVEILMIILMGSLP